jgi:serine/threonine protein kinase/tetratricopeptide (TPR) repeat protein
MGEVYAALDPRLLRRVALKVLPAEIQTSPESLERFRREAQSLAALNHPGIVTIHSVEEDAGTHFLTMEPVEGRSLVAVLAGGEVDRETFFEIAIALADAVAAAHARGIVHRDLKPANLMLTADGRLKVLDFGLAKSAPDAAPRDETQALVTALGHVVGTASYMSPEQANGRPVDERSDVFSLGIVLYELAAGRRPFEGDSLPAILFAVMSHQPPPVAPARPDLPAALDRLLEQCLVKQPANRGMTAARLRDELRSLRGEAAGATMAPTREPASAAAPSAEAAASSRTGPSSSTSRSGWRRPVIAVLPFRSTTRDPDLEDFAASLGGDVIDGVTTTSPAVVLPASATERYRAGPVDARQAGTELGAGYVLQGTVRGGDRRLRVTAQLVSVESGAQIWSRRYEGDLAEGDLLAAGDAIGAQIVSAGSDVHGVIFEYERQRLEGRAVAELDPWECIFLTLGYDKFLDAQHHLQARQALERAIDLDPGFALAWGYLSWVTTDEEVHGFNSRPDSMKRAAAAARRAVELDPYSHVLRWTRSRVHFFEGDLEGFLVESAKSLELNASDATTIGLTGLYSALAGHWQRGKDLIRRAMELNPSYPSYYHLAFAFDHFQRGEYEEALAECRRITGGYPVFQGLMPAVLGHLGRRDEAAAALRELHVLLPDATPAAIRALYQRWNVRGPFLESLLEGLVKAGLEGDRD